MAINNTAPQLAQQKQKNKELQQQQPTGCLIEPTDQVRGSLVLPLKISRNDNTVGLILNIH